MDYISFFSRPSKEVAKDLVGRTLVRETEKGSTSARILVVGAYEGGKETEARKGMMYAPGKVFFMPYRGHRLFNIATDREGFASCVDIRQIATHSKTINGSGAVTNFFGLPLTIDGVLLGGEMQIIGEPDEPREVTWVEGDKDTSSNCLGYYTLGSSK
jgi:3-methyladenine DNA glycosylase Mpg